MTCRRSPPDTASHATWPTDSPASSRPTSGSYLAAAFADTPALAAEISRLRADLADARLDRANLAAAALATIAAHHDGEPDPLCYLRDELRAQGYTAHRGAA